MKVENVGNQTIKIEASYDEISRIVHVLDRNWMVNEDELTQKLAYELHNAKVVTEK